MRTVRILVWVVVTLLAVAGCGAGPGDPRGGEQPGGKPVLNVGAIPDQDPQILQRTYGTLSRYLGDELGVPVRYRPVTDYTASVTAFSRGDLDLVFFGGLTGVQARAQTPGAVPVAQRDIDEEFRSVFVANTSTELRRVRDLPGLRQLAGYSFTFGSDTSTSGRLMPQHFMAEAGLSLADLKGEPGFSGAHDATAELVESGAYQVGVLSASVWDDRVESGQIDTDKVREIFRTPPYHDYHWLARPDLDDRFGDGFSRRVTETLLGIDGSEQAEREILRLFDAERFIATEAGNYRVIETVARSLRLLR